MPSTSPHYDRIKRLTKPIKNTTLHCDLPSLAPLILEADIGIGAGGATNWERFCLGLPSLVITLAENQKQLNRDLHNMGLIELIGDAETVKSEQVCALIKLVCSRGDLADWSNRCMRECSGDGVFLVAEALIGLTKK
jgi:UDP-2,4-diacetamido-2,4,6-trideoxy-beta-L-altropyranose hydrolase